MKILIVNLDRSLDRKNNMIAQMDSFGISNYEFVSAVDGVEIANTLLNSVYSEKNAKRLIASMSKYEVACALSHQKIYKRSLETGERYIILEDDIQISKEFAQMVTNKSFDLPENDDIIFFSNHSSNVEADHLKKSYAYTDIARSYTYENQICRVYLRKKYLSFDSVNLYEVDSRMYTIDLMNGTYAYSPSVNACKKLLKNNTPITLPADMVWNFVPFNMYTVKENIILHDYDVASTLSDRKEPDSQFFEMSDNFKKELHHQNLISDVNKNIIYLCMGRLLGKIWSGVE